MYHFFLGDIHFPVTPESFEIKTGSKNKTVDLLTGEDINILGAPALKEIRFKALLPETEYPFCNYYGGFISGREIMRRIERMKRDKETVQFIVFRHRGLKYLGHVNLAVNVEGFSVEESAEQGYDKVLEITLKEYRYYATRVYTENADGTLYTAAAKQENSGAGGTTVTVKSGDTLWDIAQRYYGDGSLYTKIYEANKGQISDPRVVKIGQELVLPKI